MNNYSFFESVWTEALGWTLLHSLWQGVIIAMLLAVSLLIFKGKSANFRYLLGAFALSGLLIGMGITFSLIYDPVPEIEPLQAPTPSVQLADNQVDSKAQTITLNDSTAEPLSLKANFVNYFEEHMPFIILLYLIGVLILTMRMLGELVFIQNLRHSRSQFVSEVWQSKLDSIAKSMNIRTKIVLKESVRVSSPMIIGILRPIIFVPFGLLANLPSGQIESILAHELAHIRRHDYLVNLIQSFVEILLFFNPSVWWISSFIRSERENCCDDIAIKMTGDELTFARTLANLEEWRIQNGNLALAFAGRNKSGVLKRIQRLLEKKESIQLPFRLFWGATILIVGLFLSAFQADTSEPIVAELENEIDALKTTQNLSVAAIANLDVELPKNIGIATISNDAEVINNSVENIANTETTTFSENTITPLATITSTIGDTIPNQVKILKQKINEIQKNFHHQQQQLIKEMKELETKRFAIEKEIQKEDYDLETIQLDLQREMQKIEKENMQIQRELNLEQNNQEEIILELEFQIQELELDLDLIHEQMSDNEDDEKLKNEISEKRKQIQEIRKNIITQQKVMAKKEIEAKKQAIMIQKEVQEKMYNNQLLEHDAQMKAHSQESKILAIEEAAQKIQQELEVLEHEVSREMIKLQNELEMELQKIEKEEY